MTDWWLPFLWLLNGLFALLWLLLEHFWQVALVPALAYVAFGAPPAQRKWAVVVCVLALLGGVLAPFPAALLLLLMAGAGWGAYRLERLSPQNTYWTMLRGLGLYALIALGYVAYRRWFAPFLAADPALLQGQAYLSAIASIALYLFPVGYLAVLAQGLFAHPPFEHSPDDLIFRYRSRGKP